MKRQGKAPDPTPEPEVKQSKNAKFRTFAYYLAWISFLSAIGSAVYMAVKDHQPPDKDEFYK